MRQLFSAAICLCIVTGCANQNPEPVSRPATTEEVEQIRQTMRATDPKAVVGIVIATLPDQRFAAVGDVPVMEFRLNEPITFIDARQHPLAHGVIKNITTDALHVKYDPPAKNGRDPQVGDLAIRFKP